MKQNLTQERVLKLMGILKEEKENLKGDISSDLLDYWKENNKADASPRVLKLFGIRTPLDKEAQKAFDEFFKGNREQEYQKWLFKPHKFDNITFKIKDFHEENTNHNPKTFYDVILDESSSMTLLDRDEMGDNVLISHVEEDVVIPGYGRLNSDDVYMIIAEVKEKIAEYIRDNSIDYFGIYPNVYWTSINIDGFAKENSLKESKMIEYYAETQEELEDLMEVILEQRNLLTEAKYQGRTVKLGKIMQGDVKKFKVYVKNDKGNVVKVNFGQKGMNIKKNNPARRKSFRARHNCDNPGPRWKARYWACRTW